VTPFVVDTSVAMAWYFEDEATDQTAAVLDLLTEREAVVPTLWFFEISNVLTIACRRQRTTEAHATRFLELLAALPILADSRAVDMAGLMALAARHRLTAYDAAYLLLSERLGAPLATLDADLTRAARAGGVELLIESA
jgi:predicted nucleic acid-binding protein